MIGQIRLAGCILPDREGRVLLLHRNTSKRVQWEIPGGKIEDGESETGTVVREIKEELKIDVQIVRLLGAHDFKEDGFIMSYHWFLAAIIRDAPTIGEPQTFDDLRYFSQAQLELKRNELSANTRNFLVAWQAGEFSLEL